MAFLAELPSLRTGNHDGDIVKLGSLRLLCLLHRSQEVLDC
jgi:hypothetical protein